jgi:NAD(P)-dependent dehydrogenase (short-subunit alcohol dehydrogenase family)
MSSYFNGKSALVFGSGQNIGRAIVREFAKRGARVAVADLDFAGAEEGAALIRAAGGEAVALRCNVMQSESITETAAAAEAALGEIDIVMNNAGLLHSGNPEDFPISEWERMIGCNLMGMVRSIEVFLPKMLARGHGHIVNTGSFAGLYPYAASRLPYAVSKAGVIALSENLALYAIPKGVKVSCLIPGPVMTTSANTMKTFSENVPMRGPGKHLWLKSQEEVAVILADGLEADRILIPTHEEVRETLLEWADSPDGFIRKQIAAFAAGDIGQPRVDRAKFGL